MTAAPGPQQPDEDAPDVWEGSIPPGGYVCGSCGMPVESEPCAEHQPVAYASCIGTPAQPVRDTEEGRG